jgi:hypothetical protein
MSLPNTGNILIGYQLRLGIPAPPRFPDVIDELFIVLGYKTLVDYVNLISYLNPTIALQQASYF